MIQQKKSVPPPESLQTGRTCRGGDVIAILGSDQHEKCYLCESKTYQSAEIDHLKSRKHYPELACDWENLFLVCGYCNKKKGDDFDDIVNPLLCPVEELLDIVPDFITKRVDINILREWDGAENTQLLLHRIHNGTQAGMRKYNERMFFERFSEEMMNFTDVVNTYAHHQTDSNRKAVVAMLHISRPFLAAKLSLLRQNTRLMNDFSQETQWNK